MHWYEIVAIVLVGFIAGFLNTLAGSGTLLTLPFLIFLGLPPNVANGTNRIAILLQNVVGVSSFKKQKIFEFRDGIGIGIFAILGSILGAQLAVDINEKVFENVIGGLLIFMIALIFVKPKRWLEGSENKHLPKYAQYIIFFLIGAYGGFIQAGVGFFLLAGLVLGSGFDLVKANALKLFLVLLYTPFALFIFIINHQVNYLLGFILSIGNMGGAFVASKMAVKKGAKFIRWILIVALLVSAIKLLGIF